MANPTPELRLERQTAGTNANTWGDVCNVNFALIEDAISGMKEIATTGGTTTLTTANAGASYAASEDQARYAILKITGVLTSNATIVAPAVSKKYHVWNATSGAFTVTVKVAGAGVVVAQGEHASLVCDGTEFYSLYKDSGFIDYLPAGTGAVATNVQAVNRRRISVFDFMTAAEIADVQGHTELVDVRAAVQKAIDYASSVHGVVEVPPGIYIIGDSGSDMATRSYGLLLKSNCEIVGESARLCVFKTKTAADIDLVTTDRTTPSTNIALRNLTLDGNADGTDTDLLGFNAWFLGVTNLVLDGVISQYPESWGLRIQTSSPVQIDNLTCYHDTATNADGLHFVDCSNVVCTNLDIYTEGDDGFVIESINSDADDYSIAGIKVTSTSSRGILIFSDPAIVPAARTISNINITGAVVSDSASAGVVLSGASFNNIKIDAVVSGCRDGLYIVPGDVVYPAVMRNCKFDVLAQNLSNYGAISLSTFSTYKNNEINVNVYNPGDGFPGVSLSGDYWSGSLIVDYDPNSDKGSPSAGVVIGGDFCNLKITSIGGSNNSLQIASTAQDNNICLGLLSGGVTNDLFFSGGATRNHFSGGTIAGAINLSGATGNTFNNVTGATFYGTKSLNFATLGTGDVVVAHGLKGTPTFISVTLQSGVQVAHIQPISADGTNITFRGWNTTGPALITTGTYSIHLDCRM